MQRVGGSFSVASQISWRLYCSPRFSGSSKKIKDILERIQKSTPEIDRITQEVRERFDKINSAASGYMVDVPCPQKVTTHIKGVPSTIINKMPHLPSKESIGEALKEVPLPDVNNMIPAVTNIPNTIKKGAFQVWEDIKIPVWYTDSQKRLVTEWDSFVRNISWSDNEFIDESIVKYHPFLILAKIITELSNKALETKAATNLLPVAVGLCTLMNHQKCGKIYETAKNIDSAEFAYWVYHHSHIAEAPHKEKPIPYLLSNTFILPENILDSKKSELWRPGYIMARNDITKEIVISFCGTTNVGDFLLDLSGSVVPFKGGYTHKGALVAARWCLSHLGDTLQKELDSCPGYHLKLVGHSLGGAVAILCTIILQDDYNIETITFGPPPICCEALMKSIKSPITNIITEHDLVPQLFLQNYARLEDDLISSSSAWGEEVVREMRSNGNPIIRTIVSRVTEKIICSPKKEKLIDQKLAGPGAGKEKEKEILTSQIVDVLKKEIETCEKDKILTGDLKKDAAGEPVLYHPGSLVELYSEIYSKNDTKYKRFRFRQLDNVEYAKRPVSLSNDMLSEHALSYYVSSSWASLRHSKNIQHLVPMAIKEAKYFHKKE